MKNYVNILIYNYLFYILNANYLSVIPETKDHITSSSKDEFLEVLLSNTTNMITG